mmetsp:Transcript_100910/g.266549  ORF Transcript_100910/g.266549 Transcript_100910/m.266549 type:complete len:457 (+) Transcript_100910:84-1454(+)
MPRAPTPGVALGTGVGRLAGPLRKRRRATAGGWNLGAPLGVASVSMPAGPWVGSMAACGISAAGVLPERSSCTRSRATSTPSCGPDMRTSEASTSTQMRVPVWPCSAWIMAPPLPISLAADAPAGMGTVQMAVGGAFGSSSAASEASRCGATSASTGRGVSTASITSCFAVSICSGVPAMRTRQTDGCVLSTSMRAPLLSWSSRSLWPPMPSTAPVAFFGRSRYSDSPSAVSMARVSTSLFACSTLSGSPPMMTLQGSTSLSTSTFAPVVAWISLICAPRMPMTLPILALVMYSTVPLRRLASSTRSQIMSRAFSMACAEPNTLTGQGSECCCRASTCAPLPLRMMQICWPPFPITFAMQLLGTSIMASRRGSSVLDSSCSERSSKSACASSCSLPTPANFCLFLCALFFGSRCWCSRRAGGCCCCCCGRCFSPAAAHRSLASVFGMHSKRASTGR